MTTYNTNESATPETNSNSELNIYQNAIRFVMATEFLDEDRAADVILRQLNGHSNSLLLYEIRAGVNAIRATRSRLVINWERAWLN